MSYVWVKKGKGEYVTQCGAHWAQKAGREGWYCDFLDYAVKTLAEVKAQAKMKAAQAKMKAAQAQ